MNKSSKELSLRIIIFNPFIHVLFAALTLTSTASLADTFAGILNIKNDGYYLVDSNLNTDIPLKAGTTVVKDKLALLKTRDFVMGAGEMINNVWVVNSIDFVGLRDLIGLWMGNTTYLNFKDFSRVHIYHPGKITEQSDLNYSISPGQKNQWKVFFSNESQVVLSTLILNDNQSATIQFYDSETGEVNAKIDLKKLTSNNAAANKK